MTEREKLINLIANGRNCPTASCCDCKYYFFEAPEDRPRCNADALLADTLIDNGVTFRRWIPVTERLPEREEDVLMLFETGVVTGGFICDSDTWCAYSDGEYYTDCCNNPTQWMPLPEPPKE